MKKGKVNIRFIGMLQIYNVPYIAKATISHSKENCSILLYIYIYNNLEILHNNIYGRINLS